MSCQSCEKGAFSYHRKLRTTLGSPGPHFGNHWDWMNHGRVHRNQPQEETFHQRWLQLEDLCRCDKNVALPPRYYCILWGSYITEELTVVFFSVSDVDHFWLNDVRHHSGRELYKTIPAEEEDVAAELQGEMVCLDLWENLLLRLWSRQRGSYTESSIVVTADLVLTSSLSLLRSRNEKDWEALLTWRRFGVWRRFSRSPTPHLNATTPFRYVSLKKPRCEVVKNRTTLAAFLHIAYLSNYLSQPAVYWFFWTFPICKLSCGLFWSSFLLSFCHQPDLFNF